MSRPWLLLVPGSRWDDVAGTDRHLATALAERVEVVWVDPPYPWQSLLRGPRPYRGLEEVRPGVHRLQTLVPPASSRAGLRRLAAAAAGWQLAAVLRRDGVVPVATVLSSPRSRLPLRGGGTRMLFVTDDWPAGAPLMGLSPAWVAGTLAVNLARADVVAAVSPALAEQLATGADHPVAVVANGTSLRARRRVAGPRYAGVVGQLNERLDLEVLELVAARGVPLLLVGPRAVRDEQVGRRLDALLARPNVEWTGLLPTEELGRQLSRMGVGLTPYTDTAFNRASFPLKTLEYLGAGLPVVSTDLPASRALATPHVRTAQDPHRFADLVEEVLATDWSGDDEATRRAIAAEHTWDARATQVLELLGVAAPSVADARTSRQ